MKETMDTHRLFRCSLRSREILRISDLHAMLATLVPLISAWCKAGAGFPEFSTFTSGKPAFPALHLRFDFASLATLAKY